MISSSVKKLLIIQAMMNIAMAIAGSFSLIYLVNRGFSYQESLIYLIVAILTTIVLTIILSNRGGMHSKRSIMASNLFLAISYGSFLVLDGYALLIIPGIFYGFQIVFFWIPLNVLLAQQSKDSNRGFTIGVSFFIYPVVAVLMPVLGGSIIESLDFYVVFLIATIILLINAITIAIYRDLPWGKLRMRIRSMKESLWKGLFFQGMQEGVFFFASPLLTYHFAGGEFKTGIMFSFFALIGTLAAVFIARVSDREQKRLVFAKIGALGAIPGMLIAGMASDINVFLLGMGILNFFIPMVAIFLMTQAGDGKNKGSAMLTREFCLNTGRLVTLGMSLFLIPFLGIGGLLALSSVFLIGVLAVK